jgi:hypothetical protein
VADHRERLGIARRVNLPKLTPRDIERAVSQDRAGDSLAAFGKTLSVDASTVQRSLWRAGVPMPLDVTLGPNRPAASKRARARI